MGRAILGEIAAAPDLKVGGGIEAQGHEALGADLGVLAGGDPLGVMARVEAGALMAQSDVVIEFSSPEATVDHARLAAQQGVAHVIGTTGFAAADLEALAEAAETIPILRAANMSLGVNLLLGLTAQVARALPAEAFDIEILETHHRHKVDAPSGTALALGDAAARGRAVILKEVAVRSRDGITGARGAGQIGFAALRGGDVVGDHMVMFAGSGERIELVHRASDRRIYARGAIQAARWLCGRPPGLYGMADVLGFAPARI